MGQFGQFGSRRFIFDGRRQLPSYRTASSPGVVWDRGEAWASGTTSSIFRAKVVLSQGHQ